MKKDGSIQDFLNSTEDQYGPNFRDHVLEQYKIYVEMADKISERRSFTNTFFLTVITVLISLIGVVSSFGKESTLMNGYWIIVVSIVGIVLCYIWYRIIESYRQLNTGKFLVIHKIEKHLPISLYDKEWEMLGEGKDKKIYNPLTRVEQNVPLVFMLIFFALMVGKIYFSI